MVEPRTSLAAASSQKLLSDVNGLQRAAGSRDSLGSFDEEILEAATEIK